MVFMVIPDSWGKSLETVGRNTFPWSFIFLRNRTERRYVTVIQFSSFKERACLFEKEKGAQTHFAAAAVGFKRTDCSSHYHMFVFSSADTC